MPKDWIRGAAASVNKPGGAPESNDAVGGDSDTSTDDNTGTNDDAADSKPEDAGMFVIATTGVQDRSRRCDEPPQSLASILKRQRKLLVAVETTT